MSDIEYPDLISGAEALRALADGKKIIGKAKDYEGEWHDAKHWALTAFLENTVYFKVKPQTIKVELELPKPFDPKVGEKYWYLKPNAKDGFDWALYHGDSTDFNQLGAWRTEEEIKQVVAELRGALK